MIEMQLFIWTTFSIIGGLIAYIILTEGKSRFLFVTSFFFSLFLGIATSYIWLQTTKGLQLFSWALFVLPLLISSIGTILFLSYYKAYHPSTSFPRIPTFTTGKTSSFVSLLVIIVLSIMLASSYFPSTAPAPTIATFGSSGSRILSSEDVANTSVCIDCIKSKDIMIQKSVITPTSIRDDPMLDEYLDFKIELTPSYAYGNPSLKVFVKDQTGNLIPSSKIIDYPSTSNVLEGQIYCDTAGTYTITAVLYDLSISSTTPMASNTLSYTVSTPLGLTQPADIFAAYMLIFLLVIVIFIWCIAIYKRVTR